MRRSLAIALAIASLPLFSVATHAAGGHFDVDDATVLEPGHCQYEAWVVRAPAAGATVAHIGPGCRVGPVEVGVNVDRWSVAGNGRTLLGPQLKWVVDPLVDRLSAGLAWSAFYDLTNHGRPTQTLYAPVTWWVAEKVWLHANIGADRDTVGARWRRQGLSGEWAANAKFTVIAERVKFVGDWTSRVGGRFNVSETLSVDLSAARFGPRGERVYVIGVNQEFVR
ncbi:MAG: hypothetical protein ABI887_01540 [Burkholderiales bacterium]